MTYIQIVRKQFQYCFTD